MKTAVMTDSNSGITPEEGKKIGIYSLPMPVIIEGDVFYEGKNITQEEYYGAMTSGKNVTTSQPSPGDVMDMWDGILKEGYEQILSAFANQEADILIGTQMIVKGHDFPNVTLVGVLAADLSLYVSDYHAAERTFQLLTQAAGRAGRGSEPGEVVIQTYRPDHYSVQTAKEQDYEAFYEQEMEYRRMLLYPPVWNMLVILCASKQEQTAYDSAKLLVQEIDTWQENIKAAMERVGEDFKKKRVFPVGPADPAVAKVNDIYKKVIYIKTKDYQTLVELKDRLEHYMRDNRAFKDTVVQFDFNPMSGF